jgi:colanic acid biosynthesis glycosyl transferase WcaI
MALAENSTASSVSESAAVAERVLIYGMNYAPEPTGVGRYTGEIGSYLAKQGVIVDVVTAVPHYPGWIVRGSHRNRYSVEQIDGAYVTRCPLLLKADMRGLWRVIAPLSFALTSAPVAIWRILMKRPNTVLCIEPTLFAAPAALLAAKIIGARTILHVQDLEIDAAFAVGHVRGEAIRKLAYAIEKFVLRAFDAVVTISNRMREHIFSKGVAPARLSIVRNWVDLEKIRPLDRPSTYRSELGFSGDDFVALYAGNIGPKQALPIVLDAAGFLTSETKIKFVIVGEGPEKSRLVALYSHLCNVRFLPVQPENRLCDLLNLANVHLLPQDRGAADLVLPSKIGGMLASGKRLVVMADPGTELFSFLSGCAVIIPPGDSLALATAITRVSSEARQIPLDSSGACIAALDAKHSLSKFKALLTAGL